APFRSAPYDALGYRCSLGATRDAFPLVSGGPLCRTVFFIDSRSGRLGTFYTSDPHYRESRGVRVGMPTAEAVLLLHHRLHMDRARSAQPLSLPPGFRSLIAAARRYARRHRVLLVAAVVVATLLDGLARARMTTRAWFTAIAAGLPSSLTARGTSVVWLRRN